MILLRLDVYVTNSHLVKFRNWVYVNNDLIEMLSGFFSIDKNECLEIIKRWVSSVLNMEVGRIENTYNPGDNHRLYKNR